MELLQKDRTAATACYSKHSPHFGEGTRWPPISAQMSSQNAHSSNGNFLAEISSPTYRPRLLQESKRGQAPCNTDGLAVAAMLVHAATMPRLATRSLLVKLQFPCPNGCLSILANTKGISAVWADPKYGSSGVAGTAWPSRSSHGQLGVRSNR